MNKTAIKNFAIWARNKLIADISYKAGLLGITDKTINSPLPQSTKDVQFFDIGSREPYQITGAAIVQRKALADKINERAEQSDYTIAYKAVIEEVAYTWFNRLIAVRFMEVKDYLPSRVRVLSSVDDKQEPDIVTTPFDTDLDFSQTEREYIVVCKSENKLDELFRMLFIKQCNTLNDVLPELFERIGDYTELLLNISFTDKDGVVWHLVNDVEESDFTEAVEIIGWMYQYYNTEPKDEAFALLKKNVKITKERIPAATQLFTPDWIVRYMVENSLGRLWLEGHPNDDLKKAWKYYLDEAEQTPEVQAQLEEIRAERRGLTPEDITFIDPCMGSAHILVYAFDVFMQIYESAGYSKRDAAKLILEKNIHGLDIDKRAYQLAYFALMMKARQYNRRIFSENVKPQVYHPAGFADGEEFGSLLKIEDPGEEPKEQMGQFNLFDENHDIVTHIWNFKQLLTQKYDVVSTNPPYMGGKGQNVKISEFLATYYADVKSDTFSAFIVRCCEMTKSNGFVGMFTPYVWMFIYSYEKLRNMIYSTRSISSMIQFEYSAFEEATVPVCSFVLQNNHVFTIGQYLRLVDFRGGMEIQRQKYLEAVENPLCGFRYIADSNSFAKIPGSPIAYWASEAMLDIFSNAMFYDYTISDGQNKTGDNARFIRFHWEVNNINVGIGMKWLFYAKGGGFRKWVGNLIDVVDWSEPTRTFYKKDLICRIIPEYLWYQKGITWGLITSNIPSFRVLPEAATFDVGGSSVFFKSYDMYNYFLGLLNSKVFLNVVKIFNPTLNFQVKDIRSMPIVIGYENEVMNLVEQNISISRVDWDSFETSWDFKRHSLV